MRLFPLSNGFVNLDLVRRVCDRSGYCPTADGSNYSKVSVSVEYIDGDVNQIGGADALRLLDFLRHEAAASLAGYYGTLAVTEDDGAGHEPIVVAGGVPEF